MAVTHERVMLATKAWLDGARRVMFKQNPHRPALPAWESFPMSERIKMMGLMKVALEAAEPANVQRAALEVPPAA
jgi:hypothetical protein